jgi:hypothetical protein
VKTPDRGFGKGFDDLTQTCAKNRKKRGPTSKKNATGFLHICSVSISTGALTDERQPFNSARDL